MTCWGIRHDEQARKHGACGTASRRQVVSPDGVVDWLLACPSKGFFVPIAATALTHDLTVVTRNTADFRKTGVKVVNPFEG